MQKQDILFGIPKGTFGKVGKPWDMDLHSLAHF